MLHAGLDSARIVNSLHKYVNVSVLLKVKADKEGKIIRYIDQVCFFSREKETNHAVLVVENGKLHKERIPATVRERVEAELGNDMFAYYGGNE